MLITQDRGIQGEVVQAMSADGTPLWAVTAPPSYDVRYAVAGPRIFAEDFTGKRVSVYDRTGHPMGSGPAGGAVELVFSPVSAEWAWSTIDTGQQGQGPVMGSFWVAGVGESPHRVYRWSEPDPKLGTFDRLVEWSDQGLISSPNPPNAGCTMGFQTVSYAIDPSSGARTLLADDGRSVQDVHAGVVTAYPHGDARAIELSGSTSFTWTDASGPADESIMTALISPDGSMVMVPMRNVGCMTDHIVVRTAFINVADHNVSIISGVQGLGWLDDGHVVAFVPTESASPELDIVGLDGSRSLLGHGNLVGVVTPS